MSRPPRPSDRRRAPSEGVRPGQSGLERPVASDVERLRHGSRTLTRLNAGFADSLDRLAGATVRLYRHNRRLAEAEKGLRACADALATAALRSGGGR